LTISIFVHKNSHFLFLSFKFAQSQIDLAKFSDRQNEEGRQAMTRFSMILQDQESVNFAHEFQETCRGWTFWFSLQQRTDLSLAKTQLKFRKSQVFFVPFSQAGLQITDPFFASFGACSAL
jgi:hypothetical protein